jgi:hypothetical protein
MRRKIITGLLIVFVILALIAGILLYYTHQLPVRREQVVTLYTYEQYGTFDYIAMLKPNTIYDKTTLRPGEGSLFTYITNSINVSFTYNFQGDKSASLTVRYSAVENLESSMWQKRIGEVQQKTVTFTGTNASLNIYDIPPVNVSSIKSLADAIAQETGAAVSEYNVTTTVQMDIQAETPDGLISEAFAPKLNMQFPSIYGTSDIITTEGFQNSKTGNITRTDIIYEPLVENQRYLSYALSMISFPGVLLIAWAYVRSKPTEPVKPEALFEELIEPYKEIIIDTVQETRFQEHPTVVHMKTLEDLAKVADTLAKPIVHTRKPPETHMLYVIDETTLYEYTITESDINERLKKEEEEE